MATNEGFLTDEQREMLKVATQNADTLSSSPKSPRTLLSEHPLKVPAAGKAPTAGLAVRHVRRSHSGKFIRVKKGMLLQFWKHLVLYALEICKISHLLLMPCFGY